MTGDPKLLPHSLESIRSAAEEFLGLLDEFDVSDTGGYYQEMPRQRYFAALYNDLPGAWDTTVRNIAFGLDRFPAGRVLDIGCGHGLQSFVFARHGHPVIGLDTEATRTTVSNRIAEAAALPWLQFQTGNARTGVRDMSGTSLWMHRSFHHIPERSDFDRTALAYFSDVSHALHEGGVLVFMTSNASSRSLVPGVRKGQHSAPHLRHLLQLSGFEVQEISYQGYLTALPPKVRPRQMASIDRTIGRIPGLRLMGGSFSVYATKQ